MQTGFSASSEQLEVCTCPAKDKAEISVQLQGDDETTIYVTITGRSRSHAVKQEYSPIFVYCRRASNGQPLDITYSEHKLEKSITTLHYSIILEHNMVHDPERKHQSV